MGKGERKYPSNRIFLTRRKPGQVGILTKMGWFSVRNKTEKKILIFGKMIDESVDPILR